MACRAFLTDTAVDAPILDTVFRTPPSTGATCHVGLFLCGRATASCQLASGGNRARSRTNSPPWRVLHRNSIFVAFAYNGGPIMVRDSWHGPDVTGSRFDARRAAFGDATLRWAGVFASFLLRHCGLPILPEAVYAPHKRHQEMGVRHRGSQQHHPHHLLPQQARGPYPWTHP